MTDRENNTTTFTYFPSPAHHLNEIKDPLNRTPIRNDYDPVTGRLVSQTDAFGNTITYDNDVANNLETITDRNGNTRALGYDERGNVTYEGLANGKQILRTFNSRNKLKTETISHDPTNTNPPKTEYFYDSTDEDLLEVKDPENHSTFYTYNSRKQVLTIKDPKGFWTVNDYDTKGNLTRTRSGGASDTGPFLSETTYTR